MNCPRPGCNGLLVPETVWDGNLALDLMRCINCGRMGKPNETLITDRLTHADPNNKKEGETMPRGPWTPEQRARFEQTMAAKQGHPKKPKAEERAVVPVVHDAVRVSRPVDFSALDVMIEETRQDLAALERAQEILQRRAIG